MFFILLYNYFSSEMVHIISDKGKSLLVIFLGSLIMGEIMHEILIDFVFLHFFKNYKYDMKQNKYGLPVWMLMLTGGVAGSIG